MSATSSLVICPDRQILSDLAPLLSQCLPLVPVLDVGHYPDRAQIDKVAAIKKPTLCFLEVSTNAEQAFVVLGQIFAACPSAKVVVILGANDPDLILRCLRAGATEFLICPVNAIQLKDVLGRLKHVVADGSGGKIIAVMPVKGAVGASTVATNMVFQWKRLGARRLLIADFDLTAGTLSFLLKVKSNYSFLDALSRADTLDSDLWKGLVVHEHGVDVLLAPENPVDTTHELPDPAPVLAFCKAAYDAVFVDLGEPYSSWSHFAAAAADELLLVSTNELPSLRSAQRVLHNLEEHQVDMSKIKLVVNRYSSDVGLTQDAIETALGIPVFQILPSDYEGVQRALVEGKSISSTSALGKAYSNMAETLYGNRVAEKKVEKKTAGWVSFFGNLVGRSAT